MAVYHLFFHHFSGNAFLIALSREFGIKSEKALQQISPLQEDKIECFHIFRRAK